MITPMLSQLEAQQGKVAVRQFVSVLGLLLAVAGFVSIAQLAVSATDGMSHEIVAKMVVFTTALLVFSNCVSRGLKPAKGGG